MQRSHNPAVIARWTFPPFALLRTQVRSLLSRLTTAAAKPTWSFDSNYSNETNYSSGLNRFGYRRRRRCPANQHDNQRAWRKSVHRRSRFSRLRRRAKFYERLQHNPLQRSIRLRPIEDDSQDALSGAGAAATVRLQASSEWPESRPLALGLVGTTP